MSRNQMLVLGGCVGAVLVCVCVCGLTFLVAPTVLIGMLGNAGAGISDDPAKARQTATSMADYTLPPGYVERASVDFVVAKLVVISPPDEIGMAIIMGQATGMSRTDLERIMRDQFAQNPDLQMQQVGTEQVTIKNRPSQMNIYESTGGEGVRQGIVGFDGKGGSVVLMFIAQIESWDKPTIDRFLASIR